jgi:hypothetical protein
MCANHIHAWVGKEGERVGHALLQNCNAARFGKTAGEKLGWKGGHGNKCDQRKGKTMNVSIKFRRRNQ